jgi:hypothetical protein
MGIEILHHDPDYLCVRVIPIDEVLHTVREVLFRAPGRHCDMSPAGARLKEHEQVTRPVALILVIVPLRFAGRGRLGVTDFSHQLIGTLIKAHHRKAGVIGLGVEIQHLLHAPHKFSADRRDTPLLFQPRLDRVFFSVRPTVSSEMASTIPTSTKLGFYQIKQLLGAATPWFLEGLRLSDTFVGPSL